MSAAGQHLPGAGGQAGRTRLDRPWRRPGAMAYALSRLPGLLRPPVSVDEPAAGSLTVLRDLPAAVRDGTILRVNVVLPPGGGRFPVLMSAHPYGKDNLPRRRGRGWQVPVQYRVLRQTSPVRFSSLTGWEAPDPAWWAAEGYAVVNCDLRGRLPERPRRQLHSALGPQPPGPPARPCHPLTWAPLRAAYRASPD